MADPEHLEILKQGVEAWNEWRRDKPTISPDLSHADLIGQTLLGIDFSGVELSGAILYESSLAWANLSSASLHYANFQEAILLGANFSGASFAHTDLLGADLSQANLRETLLYYTFFLNAKLVDVDFSGSIMCGVAFGDNDLSVVKGLETVRHSAPSAVDTGTIYRSKGNIPEIFLRGCGVPEDFITYMRSLVVQPIQFYKSFISYSSKDQKFADRLYADLQNKGVRCWLATEDLKIGAKIRTGIDEAIRLHDKLLLVLSKYSVVSDWVEQEVETALERERKEKRLILFPIRLDETVMKVEGGWPALIRNTRNIGDFRRWKDHDAYQKAFDRLLRDLKAEDGQAAEG